MRLSRLTYIGLAICLYFVFVLEVAAVELKPFTTDECSAFPEGTLVEQKLWRDCCVAHDLAYWLGGTYAERLAADRELESCVRSHGEPGVGLLMLVGVRVGGSPFWPTSFRWGYGWPYPRFYGELTAEERVLVDAELRRMELGKEPAGNE